MCLSHASIPLAVIVVTADTQ